MSRSAHSLTSCPSPPIQACEVGVMAREMAQIPYPMRVSGEISGRDSAKIGNEKREPDRVNESDSLATIRLHRRGVIVIMAYPSRPTLPIPAELAEILAPRILAKVIKKRSGCWIRTAAVNPVTGYTRITRTIDGKVSHYLAHRIMYVLAHGQIPEGLEIDHICEVPACCNPSHLRAVTHRVNILRSKNNPYAVNARRVTCKRGHDYPDGERRCHKCREINSTARRYKRRDQGVPVDQPETHGTERGYRHWSCRCEKCREWQRQDYLARKSERGAA